MDEKGRQDAGMGHASGRQGNLLGELPVISISMKFAFTVSLLALLAACNSTSPTAKGPGGRGAFPATPVTVAKAELGDVPVEVRQIGSVDPVAVIAVKAQIGGELTQVLLQRRRRRPQRPAAF